MWIPALDSATTPGPVPGPAPAAAPVPVRDLPGRPAPPPAKPGPAPGRTPDPPPRAPGDLERRLNALLEAAGLGVRVRLFRPPPGEPRVVVRRAAGFLPGSPGLSSREHLG